MKSFVINLDRNPERLVAIGDRFAALGIAFERLSAVDARAMPSDEVAEFRRLRPSMSWLPQGQIGCFLSHLAVWRRIADGADPHAAVFEDDVHVSDDLARYLGEDSPPGNADIIRLEAPTNRVLLRSGPRGAGRAGAETVVWHGRAIRPVRSTTWCAGGYILSQTAAARLCALPLEAHQPVDYMLFCLETSTVARSLRTEQVVPALCVQDKNTHADPRQARFRSEIENDGRDPHAGRLSRLVRGAVPAIWRSLAGYERVPFEHRACGSGRPSSGGPASLAPADGARMASVPAGAGRSA